MRVVVSNEYGQDVYRYDPEDEACTSYPGDLPTRTKLIRTLTDALKFLLLKKRGALDNEI